MLLTIYNLPENTRYHDVKSLIETKCGIKEMILDNMVGWGSSKKVTVGLASEEDVTIVMREINGLFINGSQLHVEDIRKKKRAMEQPYYSMARDESDWNQQRDEPAYRDQPRNHDSIPNNTANTTNPQLEYYAPRLTAYQSSSTNSQNNYIPYADRMPVQYPTPQRMYQAPNKPQQESLGLRSHVDPSPWSRNNEPPKNSFPQRDIRWSPAAGQRNERAQEPSKWGDARPDRNGAGRRSPPRDRRLYDRDAQSGTSHQPFDRDSFRRSDNRSPQRANDRSAPKTNRNPKPNTFGKPREFARASFPNNPKQPKNKGRATTSHQHQPWAISTGRGTHHGPLETQGCREQTNRPGKKRNSDQNIQNQPQKKIRRLPHLDDIKKPKRAKPRYSAEEYAKLEAVRSETWRAQTASQIAKDMVEGKGTGDVDHATFFKELKRILRERLTGICHPLMRHDGLYAKYRKIYKQEDDVKFMQEVMENSRIIHAEFKNKLAARAMAKAEGAQSGAVKVEVSAAETPQALGDYVRVTNETKPIVKSVGDSFPTAIPTHDDNKPKYTKAQLFKFKLQKQQNKRAFHNQNLLLKALEPNIGKALEAESTLLLKKFLEECTPDVHNDLVEKRLLKRLTTTVAEDFKRVVKVQVARRIRNDRDPLVRVFCSPKMLNRRLLTEFLESQGITAMKKFSKHPVLLASCKSYDVHDRLCLAEPFAIQDRVITFKPLHIAGPAIKVTKDKIIRHRKKFIESQIDYSTDIDDNDIKLMNDIQEFQEKLENSFTEPAEGVAVVKTEVEVGSEGDNTNIIGDGNIKEAAKSLDNAIGNFKNEDFTEDVGETEAFQDFSVDDYQIIEDTIGNFEGTEGNSDGLDVAIIDDVAEEINDDNMDEAEALVPEDINNSGKFGEGVNDSGEIGEGMNDSGELDANIAEDDDNIVNRDEQYEGDGADDNDCEDIDIGDVDEDDLEDY